MSDAERAGAEPAGAPPVRPRTFGVRTVRQKLWQLTQRTEQLIARLDEQLMASKRVTEGLLSQRNQLMQNQLRALADLERIRTRPRPGS